jgi:hypothetical protein
MSMADQLQPVWRESIRGNYEDGQSLNRYDAVMNGGRTKKKKKREEQKKNKRIAADRQHKLGQRSFFYFSNRYSTIYRSTCARACIDLKQRGLLTGGRQRQERTKNTFSIILFSPCWFSNVAGIVLFILFLVSRTAL